MTNTELVELLREAREAVSFNICTCGNVTRPGAKNRELRDRIDAALAAHDAVPPSEEKVEWKTTYHDPVFHEADLTDDLCLSVLENPHGRFYWSAQLQTQKNGYADTLDEAKSAAIAAARGMK